MNAPWLRPGLSLVAAVLLAWALSLFPVSDVWRWLVLGVGLLAAVLFILVEARTGSPNTGPAPSRSPEETVSLLRVVTELHASGSALLRELEDIIQLAPDEYRVRRQRVVDWVTSGYEQLMQLDRIEAERVGNPREAEALDTYPHVTKGNIALRPLIDHVRRRLERLDAIRARR